MKRNRVALEHEAQLEREARVTEWIDLVSQYVRNAPAELACIVGAPQPLRVVLFDPCFSAFDHDEHMMYIHQRGRDLFCSVTGDPYPVDDRSLWPWTCQYGDVRAWGTRDIITCIALCLGPRHKIAMAQTCRAFRRVIVRSAEIWKHDVTAWPGSIECSMPYLFFCRLKAFVDCTHLQFKHVNRRVFKAFFALLIMTFVSPDVITEDVYSPSSCVRYSLSTQKPVMRFSVEKQQQIARLSIINDEFRSYSTKVRTSDIRQCIEWHLQKPDHRDYKTHLITQVAANMKPKPQYWLNHLLSTDINKK